MKRIYLLLLLFASGFNGVSQTQSNFLPKTNDEKELVRLTMLMSSASETGDSAVYEKYIDKDFLITYSRCNENSYGKFANKTKVMGLWTKADSSGQSHSTPLVYEVQIIHKTAVVHSYILDEGVDKNGTKFTTATWSTDVWIKRKKQWFWISAHESILF